MSRPSGRIAMAVYLTRIRNERSKQNLKWGYPQKNSCLEWSAILAEETGEAIKELNNLPYKKDATNLRLELIQVAAVAISILQHLDEGEIKDGKEL